MIAAEKHHHHRRSKTTYSCLGCTSRTRTPTSCMCTCVPPIWYLEARHVTEVLRLPLDLPPPDAVVLRRQRVALDLLGVLNARGQNKQNKKVQNNDQTKNSSRSRLNKKEGGGKGGGVGSTWPGTGRVPTGNNRNKTKKKEVKNQATNHPTYYIAWVFVSE